MEYETPIFQSIGIWTLYTLNHNFNVCYLFIIYDIKNILSFFINISKIKLFYSINVVSQCTQKMHIDTQKVHNNNARQQYYSAIKWLSRCNILNNLYEVIRIVCHIHYHFLGNILSVKCWI